MPMKLYFSGLHLEKMNDDIMATTRNTGRIINMPPNSQSSPKRQRGFPGNSENSNTKKDMNCWTPCTTLWKNLTY